MARFLKNSDPRFHLVELRSGVFLGLVLLLLLGTIGFGVWKQEWFRAAKHYRMIAATSEGLQTGMAVRLSGFRVGAVDAVELVKPGEVAVRVKVFQEYADYVRMDSRAKVRGENLIGDRFIELTAGDGQAPPAPEGAVIRIEAEPTIGAMVEELKRDFEPILAGLGEVAVKLPETVGRFDLAIDESRALIADLRGEESDLQRGFAKFHESLAGLEDLLAEFRDPEKDLMRGIAHFERASRALGEHMESVMTRLDSASGNLDEAMARTNEVMGEVGEVVGQLGEAVDEAAPEVPGMVRKGARTVDKADDVMSAVRDMWPVRGGVPRGGDQTLRTSSDD